MNKKTIITILSSILITSFLWWIYLFILKYFITDSNERGLFGDSFGGLNALVSSLALAGIIYTIFIQRKELNTQKEELLNQRKEFQINRITNIIYNEVKKCNTTIRELNLIEIDDKDSEYSGEYSLRKFDEKLESLMTKTKNSELKTRPTFAIEDSQQFRKELERIIIKNEENIDDLFHQIYNSCRIINLTLANEDIEDEDKNELKIMFILNLGIYLSNVITVINIQIKKISEENDSLGHLASRLSYINEFQNIKHDFEINQLS